MKNTIQTEDNLVLLLVVFSPSINFCLLTLIEENLISAIWSTSKEVVCKTLSQCLQYLAAGGHELQAM